MTKKVIKDYLNRSDWRVRANANQDYSLGGLILNTAGGNIANYWLNEIYPKEVSIAHREGDIHIHDLDFLSGYCAGWSLKMILEEGFNGVPGRISAGPPKHFSSAMGQVINFLGTMQNEWAGAQALSSFDTYMAPFIYEDKLTYESLKQYMQEFIFGLNVPSRWGCVDSETEVLAVDGFKKYNELKEGDEIYSWLDGKLVTNKVNKVIIKHYKGKMHSYINGYYHQMVTPEHRVLSYDDKNCDFKIKTSNYLFNQKSLPDLIGSFYSENGIFRSEINGKVFSYADLETNACSLMRAGGLSNDILEANSLSALVLINLLGNEIIPTFERHKLDKLQHLGILAGLTSYQVMREEGICVYFRSQPRIEIQQRIESNYDGIVWCPSVDAGTAIFRKDGNTFISGQSQSPFTNLTFDITCPEDLKNKNPVIGGEAKPYTYGSLQKEMDMINKAYIEIMTKGDYNGRVFTFPIPTYNITKDFNWDSENANLLFAMTAKYGLPYFQNFINSDLTPNMIRSMCCRLQLDLRELLKRGNGLFGSAEQTGSVGVVTINCARLGFLYKNNSSLFDRLNYLLVLAKNSLEIKREIIQNHLDDGLFPYSKRYLGTLRNHFSTIGVNGINEMIRNFTNDDHDITTEFGHKFAVKTLDFIRKRMIDFQEETKHLYNLEATPAEGTTYRFAKEDQKRYTGIIQAGTMDAPYYTNSSQLPVGFTNDAFLALEMQDDLQCKYTGGTVLHLFLGEKVSSTQGCKNIIKRVFEKFRLPYVTITPSFSICPKHGYLAGEYEYCPKCDADIGYNSNNE